MPTGYDIIFVPISPIGTKNSDFGTKNFAQISHKTRNDA